MKKLLRVVPAKFLQIASTIEQFGNLEVMTVEEAIGSLKAHEERLRGRSEGSGNQILLTEEEWTRREREDGKLLLTRDEWLKRTGKGGTDKSQGSTDYRVRGVRDKSKIRCFNCRSYGHFAIECRKPKREKETKEEANIVQILNDEPALLLIKGREENKAVMLVNEEKVTPQLSETTSVKQWESNLWYLDNGASNHKTGQKSKFKVLDESVTGQVKFGDGSMVCIKGKGTIIVECKNGEERMLKDVYFIPALRSNIISLGQLSEEGNKVVMCGEYLWVRDSQGNLVMKVKKSTNRLYKIILESSESRCLLSSCDKESWLWHMRFGHVNFRALKQMSETNMVRGLPRISKSKEVCEGCLMSKKARKTFPSQASYCAKKVLELIHEDLCGPISPSTTAGNKYVFLLVDDYSRVMWAYLLKSKDEAFEAFRKFRILVETQDRKIKAFRTDRGGEFMSKEFTTYCEEAGIARQFTAPYSSQQNGVVERPNRTMIEMAGSFLKEMKMPNSFWGEAVRHSIYILNRLPTRAVSGVTPYEAWSGEKPHVGHIRVFGCVAYMKVPSINLRKLDDRSKIMVNLGKEPGTKAYRLYDPVTEKVFVSRDVVFDEEKTWPWSEERNEADAHLATFTVVNHDVTEQQEIQTEEGSDTSENHEDGDETDSTGTPYTGNATDSRETDLETDSEPHHFRSLRDIYANTEEIELEDEEILLMGVDEPANYRQASKEICWRKAMNQEMDAVEKNQTWKLTELPPEGRLLT